MVQSKLLQSKTIHTLKKCCPISNLFGRIGPCLVAAINLFICLWNTSTCILTFRSLYILCSVTILKLNFQNTANDLLLDKRVTVLLDLVNNWWLTIKAIHFLVAIGRNIYFFLNIPTRQLLFCIFIIHFNGIINQEQLSNQRSVSNYQLNEGNFNGKNLLFKTNLKQWNAICYKYGNVRNMEQVSQLMIPFTGHCPTNHRAASNLRVTSYKPVHWPGCSFNRTITSTTQSLQISVILLVKQHAERSNSWHLNECLIV